jgi:hypothetical protein
VLPGTTPAMTLALPWRFVLAVMQEHQQASGMDESDTGQKDGVYVNANDCEPSASGGHHAPGFSALMRMFK